MSLVGPRPERPEISDRIEQVLPNFRDRLLVRPGVTGLAQMRLPADTDLEGVRKKLAHDLYYVREMSFLLDMRIGFSTAFYFLGAISHALCTALVRSYGRAVEHGVEQAVPVQPEAYEVGAA
jgi:lipopolysaccharide/colanic/teichoic acid biosynthesis glycosyltransferase